MKQKPVILFSFILLIVSLSCSRKTKSEKNAQNDLFSTSRESVHTWYYLTADRIEPVDLPQHAPVVLEKPWTESIRISSAGCAAGTGNAMPKGYAVVNRAGILVFNGDSPKLYDDRALFGGTTAGPLVFQNDTPLFTFFKSTIFNSGTKAAGTDSGQSMRPFLVQFRTDTNISYPLISYENLGLSDESEITGYVWDGNSFLCSIKKTTNDRILFSYISILPRKPILALSPYNGTNSIETAKITADAYRSSQTPKQWAQAPLRLKQLLASLPASLIFTVDCATAGSVSPRHFQHTVSQEQDAVITAKACIADTWIMAVFSDGTAYFAGALYDKPILAQGKPVSFRLPKLPAGFIYSDFALSGTALYAAWEESSFYKTGRSGFIQVDLNKLLYHATVRTEL